MNSEITPKLGVIDALTIGFRVLIRYPWLILVPVLLDVGLWLGPRLSVQPLVPALLGLMQLPPGINAPGDYQQALDATRQLLVQAGSSFNLFTVVANGSLGLPSVVAVLGTVPGLPGTNGQIDVTGFGVAAGWLALLGLLGIVVSTLYLVLIAQTLRAGRLAAPDLLVSFVRSSLRLIVLFVVLVVLIVALGIPFSLFAGFLTLAGGTAGMFLAVTVVLLIGWWVRLGLAFAVQAIVLDEVGIRQAVWRSLNVVMRNFWSTLGLVILISVITTGFSIVWQRVVTTPLGMVPGILGNAAIGTGLVVSGFVFYRNRYRRWQAETAVRAS